MKFVFYMGRVPLPRLLSAPPSTVALGASLQRIKKNKKNKKNTKKPSTARLPCCPTAQTPNPQLYRVCLSACCLASITVSVFLQCLCKVGLGENTTTTMHHLAIVHKRGFQAGMLCRETEVAPYGELHPAQRRAAGVFCFLFFVFLILSSSPPAFLPLKKIPSFVWRIKDL